MKNILFTIFFIAAQAYITSANAQNGDLKNASDELLKIKQEKLDIDSNLKKQEAVCYKKFAVSRCLTDVKTEAQTALNKIKRRELEIKELQRSAKAESDRNKKEKTLVEKMPRNGAEASEGEPKGKSKLDSAIQPSRAIKTDAEIQADKNSKDLSRAEAAKKRVDESNEKLVASQKKFGQIQPKTTSSRSAQNISRKGEIRAEKRKISTASNPDCYS
jgi:hypothetical protein